MKTCTKCKVEKEFPAFNKSKSKKDGFDSWCRQCHKDSKDKNRAAHAKTRKEWRARNKEKIAESFKKWSKDNKAERAEYGKQYRKTPEAKEVKAKWDKDNRDKRLAYKKKYREANPEKHYQSFLDWKAKNPERLLELKRASEIRRRDRKKAVGEEGRIPADFVREVYARFNSSCFNCGCTTNLSVDHHKPLCKGNAMSITNAVLLCRSCNSKKASKDPGEFYSAEKLKALEDCVWADQVVGTAGVFEVDGVLCKMISCTYHCG